MSLTERFANLIDSTVAVFSPRAGLKRTAARKATEQFGSFRGARRTRLSANWDITSGSADYDLLPDLEMLRERSRELVRNDPHAASVVGSYVDNVIGTGIRAQSIIQPEELGLSDDQTADIRHACEAAWNRWVPTADVARKFNFYDIQAQVMRSIIVNGEALVFPVRVERPGVPYTAALEVIEPDRLEAPDGMDNPNGKFNRRSGIELGRYGAPAAYYIRVSHPGDGTFERASDRRHRRISAFDSNGKPQILHIANTTRPGQTRGEPMLAPALASFKDLSSFTEAILVRARIEACYAMFVTKDDPYQSAVNRADETVNTQRIQEIEPGMVSYLSPGETVSFNNPGGASGSDYNQFVTRHLRSIGAALGLPYELVGKDFSQTNYSSARAALLEARRVFTRWQRTITDHLCSHMYSMVIEEAWLRGDIPIADFETNREVLTRSRWVPPSYGWVDPKKEVEAATMAIDAGLSSLAIEAAAHGRDWEQILEQQAREQSRRAELGLEDDESE